MKVDLANLLEDMKQLKKQLREENKKNKEIMKQHDDLFDMIENSNSNSNYSY
jgi:flagellar biosynthesis/type III secretory pathway chaperone